MSTASLENSKRLYELSGWHDNGDRWYFTATDGKVIGTATPRILKGDKDYKGGYRTDIPAYDAGYLLRKLQEALPHKKIEKHHKITRGVFWREGRWCTQRERYGVGADRDEWKVYVYHADTPEDALCLLAIKLFEEGVL